MKGLILTYIATAVGSVVALRRPKVGLFVYISFAILRPQAIFGWAGTTEYISRIVGIATLLGWAFNGFGDFRKVRGRPVVAALVGFTVWSSLSAFQAVYSDTSWLAVIELLKIVLPFLVGITVLDEEADARRLMWVIVLSEAYVAFELNLSYVRGYNMAAIGWAGMDNNCVGVTMVTVIGPAVAMTLAARNWRERLAAAASTALIVHATLLTFSRGALVGMLAVGATAFVIFPKRPKYLAALVVVAALAIRLTGPELAARYATAFLSSDEGGDQGEGRVDLWMDCVRVMKEHPMFGIGPWNWRLLAGDYGWTEGKSAHSVWAETAAETGVPGVLLLFSFFTLGSLSMWRPARARLTAENRFGTAAASGVILGVAGFMTSGMFVSLAGLETPYYVTLVGLVMLNASGAAAAKLTIPPKTTGPAPPPPRIPPRTAPTPRPLHPGLART